MTQPTSARSTRALIQLTELCAELFPDASAREYALLLLGFEIGATCAWQRPAHTHDVLDALQHTWLPDDVARLCRTWRETLWHAVGVFLQDPPLMTEEDTSADAPDPA